MISINKKLNAPYPAENSTKDVTIRALAYGVFVSLFLGYFKPFGLGTLYGNDLMLTCSVFGLITFVVILLNTIGLSQLFPNLFDADKWTVKKEIIFTVYIILCIGTFNFIYFAYLVQLSSHIWWVFFWRLQFGTLAIGIIPVMLFVFYDQNRLLKRNLNHSLTMNKQLEGGQANDIKEVQVEDELELIAENGKVELTVFPSQLVYLKADGNYLDIIYQKEEAIEKLVIRNRLKAVASLLDDKLFFQCHRSYIVNLNKIKSVTGNARGFELLLSGVDTIIPVSRSKSSVLEQVLAEADLS